MKKYFTQSIYSKLKLITIFFPKKITSPINRDSFKISYFQIERYKKIIKYEEILTDGFGFSEIKHNKIFYEKGCIFYSENLIKYILRYLNFDLIMNIRKKYQKEENNYKKLHNLMNIIISENNFTNNDITNILDHDYRPSNHSGFYIYKYKNIFKDNLSYKDVLLYVINRTKLGSCTFKKIIKLS